MKSILYKNIIKYMIILASTLFIFYCGIQIHIQKEKITNELIELVEQAEIAYNNGKVMSQEKVTMFQDDYLNRAYAIDFIISQDPSKNFNTELLKKIKDLMEVASVHLIAKSGEIVQSSEEESIGLNLKQYEEASSFWDLIESDDMNASVISMDSKRIIGADSHIYIGVKSTCNQYSVVQIGLEISVYEDLIQSDSLAGIIEDTPTIYEKAMFVVNKETGTIEGITKNNEQDLNIDNVGTKEEFITVLKHASKGEFITINNSLKYIITKEIDDKIVGVYMQAKGFFFNILQQCFFTICCVVVIIGVLGHILKYFIHKYILSDLFMLESTIEDLMGGNYDINFETQYNTELKQICRMLNNWKESYKTKSERMTRIINVINNQMGVFECLYSINQNFFSDNMKTLLGVNDDKWNKMRRTPKFFEQYIKELASKSQKHDNIVEINGKYLEIVSFTTVDEFYGMIVDKTEDVNQKKQMVHALNSIQEVSETDPLTQLANRRALEKYIKNSLAHSISEGIMII